MCLTQVAFGLEFHAVALTPVQAAKRLKKLPHAFNVDHIGRLYVVGGVGHARMQLSSAEAFDPREGKWVALAPMSCPRSSCGLAALVGSLYVAGGHGMNGSVHDTVEMYDPVADKWLPRASMGHARCGMALGVL